MFYTNDFEVVSFYGNGNPPHVYYYIGDLLKI